MPVCCVICDKPLGDKWGWFTPDKEEWAWLNDEQKALFSVGGQSMMVHGECYNDLSEKQEES